MKLALFFISELYVMDMEVQICMGEGRHPSFLFLIPQGNLLYSKQQSLSN
ncbi:hypothetical protein M6B38_331150 [Iris pallida]|uniref:Uncharacterized protein n=1 Tax=Iris pallida TaxID=29817 RepID=A0AAX6H3J6_IRIPA|nr:hypothetical protein M6B38_331150 [Iris pallida]